MDSTYNNATSAYQISKLAESNKLVEERRKQEEIDRPTNKNLITIIQQNNEQITLLKEQNDKLKEQLEKSIESGKNAKKDAKRNRIISYVSIVVAVASLIATIMIAVLK